MDIKQYLYNILQLEYVLQNQTQAVEAAEKEIKNGFKRFTPPCEIYKPYKSSYEVGEYTELKRPEKEPISKLIISLLIIIPSVLGILAMLSGFVYIFKKCCEPTPINFFAVCGIMIVLTFGILGGFYFFGIGLSKFKSYSNYLSDEKTYAKRSAEHKKDYEEKVVAANKKYQEKLQEYQLELLDYKKEKAKVDAKNAIVSANERTAINAVNSIKASQKETRAALNKLYSTGIIHAKYKNINAINAFCEYFDTGRCTEFEGPNGAYNIYEFERRQDMIIEKLDTVIATLNDIRSMQYVMCKELQSISSSVSQISSNVKEISRSTKKIEKLSGITAYCSAISAINSSVTAYYTEQIANNTEALKYISLVK